MSEAKDEIQLERLVSALLAGKQITNGPQSISWSAKLARGYMCCDTPDCCDYDFDSMEEVTEFIDAENWEVVAH